MPHGDPYKGWTVVSLTDDQLAFVKRALDLEGGAATDFVRKAVLDKASELLGERAPGRPAGRAQKPPPPTAETLVNSLASDPQRFLRDLTALVAAEIKKDQKGGR